MIYFSAEGEQIQKPDFPPLLLWTCGKNTLILGKLQAQNEQSKISPAQSPLEWTQILFYPSTIKKTVWCMCVAACARARVCVCVCVCV